MQSEFQEYSGNEILEQSCPPEVGLSIQVAETVEITGGGPVEVLSRYRIRKISLVITACLGSLAI